MPKKVVMEFENRKRPLHFNSITAAAAFLLDKNSLYYTWPEKNGQKQLFSLALRTKHFKKLSVEN